MRKLSLAQARRLALGAQGFSNPRPTGRVDVRHLRRVIDRIGLLQLDSVNVVVRSHYMPLFSRLGGYRHELIDDLAYKRGELFEYWGHEASLLPMDTYPLFRHRMAAMKDRWRPKKLLKEQPRYVDEVLQQVRSHGPLTVSDLTEPGERSGPWWGYSKGKTALEWLFASGDVACARRENFTRFYDVADRVISSDVYDSPVISADEAQRRLLLMAASHLGVGTAADLADYYRIRMPIARPRIHELVATGDLIEVQVGDWTKPAYTTQTTSIPKRIVGSALLTPFDPVVWHRDRGERLFDFRYRIEIYVPEPKRVYGYYVMPFLLDGELVARVDLKSERQLSRLLVRGTFLEDDQESSRVAPALAAELVSMAEWLGLDSVEVADNGNLAGALRAVV